jgi:CRP-like cAMP-binding protein
VFTISKEIARQDEKAKALYLITEGQVELRKTNDK